MKYNYPLVKFNIIDNQIINMIAKLSKIFIWSALPCFVFLPHIILNSLEMEEKTKEEAQTSIPKTVQRSAGYPASNLPDSIEFTLQVLKHFPNSSSVINRDDIAAVLGKSHGGIIRDVAAAVHFGFMEREESGYKIAESIRVLKNAIDERERRLIVLEAFCKPKLFLELIEKYDGHSIPKDLRTHLIRFHRIVDKVAEEVAAIFIDSAAYANALQSNGILDVRGEKAKLQNNSLQFAEIINQDSPKQPEIIYKENDKLTIQYQSKEKQIEYLKPNNYDQELNELSIQLTNKKFAYLKYPVDLTAKDVNIILKQIEVLRELTTE